MTVPSSPSSPRPTYKPDHLEWLLTDFLEETAGAAAAALASTDGLNLASVGLTVDGQHETLSAALCGLHSLSWRVSLFLPGGEQEVLNHVIEYEDSFLLVAKVAPGTLLGVATGGKVEAGELDQVAGHMRLLGTRVAEHLATPERAG